jgi:hypothetical protein
LRERDYPTKMVNRSPKQLLGQADDLASKEKEYEQALSLMEYHTGLLWEEFGVFLLAETVLVGFLGSALVSAMQTQRLVSENLVVFFGSILGILLCIPWYATFQHNYQYYRLRIEQAKRHESVLGTTLLSEGYMLSSGKALTISGTKLRLPLLARHMPPRRAVPLLISLFAITFLILIIITGPWW